MYFQNLHPISLQDKLERNLVQIVKANPGKEKKGKKEKDKLYIEHLIVGAYLFAKSSSKLCQLYLTLPQVTRWKKRNKDILKI